MSYALKIGAETREELGKGGVSSLLPGNAHAVKWAMLEEGWMKIYVDALMFWEKWGHALGW